MSLTIAGKASSRIMSREQWSTARAALVGREKEHTRMGDELARLRRELPWVAIQKRYVLQTADGPRTLTDLFGGRSQLLIYHFMFGPSYEAGCPVNSSIADSFDSVIPHLNARDVTLIAVSGAPIEKLLAYASGGGGASIGRRAMSASSMPTSVSPAAASGRGRRSSRVSIACLRSRSATPSIAARASTVI
jgi:predicted dithiol-disulfide oxidoreductase (DUF899 family)